MAKQTVTVPIPDVPTGIKPPEPVRMQPGNISPAVLRAREDAAVARTDGRPRSSEARH